MTVITPPLGTGEMQDQSRRKHEGTEKRRQCAGEKLGASPRRTRKTGDASVRATRTTGRRASKKTSPPLATSDETDHLTVKQTTQPARKQSVEPRPR